MGIGVRVGSGTGVSVAVGVGASVGVGPGVSTEVAGLSSQAENNATESRHSTDSFAIQNLPM